MYRSALPGPRPQLDVAQLTREDVVSFLGRFALAVVLIILTFAVARFLQRRVSRVGYFAARDAAIAALLANLTYIGALVLGIATALQAAFGVDLAALVAALGVSGLAVSLALQDILRNLVAGIYILLEKPFEIGDTITVRDQTGEVLGIDLRTTLLRTTDGGEVLVPNSAVMTEVVANRSVRGLQSYAVTVSGGPEIVRNGTLPYQEVLDSIPQVCSDPHPEARLETIEPDAVTLLLRFWTEEGGTAVADVVGELRRRVPEASVSAKAEA